MLMLRLMFEGETKRLQESAKTDGGGVKGRTSEKREKGRE